MAKYMNGEYGLIPLLCSKFITNKFSDNYQQSQCTIAVDPQVVAERNRIQNSTDFLSVTQLWRRNGFSNCTNCTLFRERSKLCQDQRHVRINKEFWTADLIQEPAPNFVDGLSFY